MTRLPADRTEAETMLAAVNSYTRGQLDRAVVALSTCHAELAAVLDDVPEGSPEREHIKEYLGLNRRYAGLLGAQLDDPVSFLPQTPSEPAAPAVPQRSLEADKALLVLAVESEAARRSGLAINLYSVVAALAAIPEADRTPDEQLQLLQHGAWSADRAAVEAARLVKAAEIAALTSFDEVDAYDVLAGWPI